MEARLQFQSQKTPARPPRGLCAGGPRRKGARGVASTSLDTGEQVGKSADYYATHKAINARLVKTLRKLSRHEDANAVEGCHCSFLGWKCDGGHRWARPMQSCQFKLCAFDMRARAQRLVGKFGAYFSVFLNPRYIVLSKKNCEFYDLKEGIVSLWAAFTRLRHRKVWKRVRGAVAVLEVTFNRQNSTWHPHLNILVDSQFLPQSDLLAEWNDVCEGQASAGVWIERADRSTLPELFKYVTKLVDFVDNAEAVKQFLSATKMLRFIRTYGEYYGFELDDEERRELTCPDCGSSKVEKTGRVWPEQLWLDDGGVLRWAKQVHDSWWLQHGAGDESPPLHLSAPEKAAFEQKRLVFLPVGPEKCAYTRPLLAAGD